MAKLLAPNGKPSNLSPEQYELVRLPEFKAWFGDWENLILTKLNDSGIDEVSLKRLEDGVSKVVDKNGEPMVVWHTTNNEFNKFDKRKSRDGFFFSPQKNRLVVYNKSKINSYFLNLRNPSHEIFKLDLKYLKPKEYDGIMDYGHDKKSGNENLYEIIAFEPNQIKLADGTNTTFDGNNTDIRFDEGGKADSHKIKFNNDRVLINGNDFGLLEFTIKENELEIRRLYLNKENQKLGIGRKIISELFNQNPDVNKIIVYPLGSSIPFWLRFTENVRNDDYFEITKNSLKKGMENYPLKNNNTNIEFKKGGIVTINPTEIECHNCHWEWKVKDGGNDLFICHKCYTDNSKFYKFEGLEGEKILDTITFKKGGRTIAQTPAPKKDQIKGSDINPKGSSTDKESAKDIKFSPEVSIAIRNNIDKHNKKYPKNKVDFNTAKAVVRRGMGAYSSSYRPTISGGKPNSRVAWGLARLNAFLYKIVNGKSKSGKYSQDNDLIEELGYKVQKYSDGGLLGNTFTEIIYYAMLHTATTTDVYAKGKDLDDIQSEYNSISASDFDNPNSNYNSKMLESRINKYEFIGDDSLNAEDYIDDLENTDYWNLISDDYDIIESDSVFAINKSTDEMIDEIREFIKQEYNIGGRYAEKYMTISVDDENGDFIADLIIRTADHSQNVKNNDRTSFNLSFVIANKNETKNRFIPLGEEYYYDDNSDIEDIKEEIKVIIDEKIEYIKENGKKYEDGGELNKNMRNQIIDILSKNKRYGNKIFDLQEIGLEVIESCIQSNTYFGNSIRQANENYIMIPVNYEDKLWAIDKKVGYVYFAKTNENTKIRVEYKYDLQDYPVPILFDSEIMNNKEFYDVNDFEEINVREFDSEFLYRGINNDEMLSIIENGFIKSNASMNIGKQQEETTSFAQHISQASAYAVGFNAWYDEVTFAKPKYILKVKKEGVNYKPTIETEIENEVDVFGEIPIQQIESIYEIKLGECEMGSVEINVGYENNFSEGSRSPMFKKVFVRKTDVNTLINENNSKNKIKKNNDMTNSNPKDEVTFNIPLLIRFAELMREDIKTDVALHEVIENIIDIKDKGVLTMSDYDSIVGNVIGTEENTNMNVVEEEKMEEGGKVESIKSKKGDIKLMLDENWYSDDTEVELVPVAELIKFREFDRKVSPKYNKENSVDNINHLKFMFQKDGVKSPLIIEYSKEDNAVLIIEGNHRLNSAIDLGMEYLPARVVLKKYSKFTKNQLKNAMEVSGVEGNEFGYIPSNMKPSKVGVQGTKPIVFGDGGIIEGRLHSECDAEEGCGRKFQVGENGHVIEAERDEAVIVADAFQNNEELTIKGTPSEVASALNVIGGGKNFDKGAEIIKNGQELDIPELKKQAIDTDVDDVIDSGSIIINRRSMADEKEYEVTGTPKQIASAINSLDGNGVVIENGAEIKEN
jgi:hypothetical protein